MSMSSLPWPRPVPAPLIVPSSPAPPPFTLPHSPAPSSLYFSTLSSSPRFHSITFSSWSLVIAPPHSWTMAIISFTLSSVLIVIAIFSLASSLAVLGPPVLAPPRLVPVLLSLE